jgi:L,D-peptidoglycan transpeptidase YkuD (ErfK/YbiS/YcfS/YnhG family)
VIARLALLALLTTCAAAPSDWAGRGSARQLVLVTTPSWTSTTGTLRRFARADARDAWRPVGAPVPVTVGKNGLAWGDPGAPRALAPGPDKVEGDLRTPAGAFRMTAAHGVAAAPPPGTRLAYTPSTPASRCVDDPRSASYNRIVEEGTVAGDWSSAETMLRADGLYDWVIVVGHNEARAPGAGSCIFLHVGARPTAGCTAMARPAIEELLAWLNPDAAVLVVLPAPALDKLPDLPR